MCHSKESSQYYYHYTAVVVSICMILRTCACQLHACTYMCTTWDWGFHLLTPYGKCMRQKLARLWTNPRTSSSLGCPDKTIQVWSIDEYMYTLTYAHIRPLHINCYHNSAHVCMYVCMYVHVGTYVLRTCWPIALYYTNCIHEFKSHAWMTTVIDIRRSINRKISSLFTTKGIKSQHNSTGAWSWISLQRSDPTLHVQCMLQLPGWSLSVAISKHLVCITLYTVTSFQFSTCTGCCSRYIHMTVCYSLAHASLERGGGERKRGRGRKGGDAGWAQGYRLFLQPTMYNCN